ncbi:MAG: PAS domain S-box protein, partial [bacterium]|nr:PAS domain S-box protein [bacterium]
MSKPTYEELEKRVKELEKAETEHKKVVDTLKETKLLQSSIIESSADIIVLSLDNKYRYTSFNSAHAIEMKKVWDVDIKLGENILDYISDKGERQKAKGNFDRALKDERFTIIDDYRNQNNRFWYKVAYNPLKDSRNKMMGLSLFLTDVTEQKKSELALQESEERLSRFMDSANDSFHILDKDYKLLNINKPALNVLIKNSESVNKKGDVLGKRLTEIYPFLKEDKWWGNFKKVLETGQYVSQEDTVIMPDGGVVHLNVQTFKVGEGIGIIASDITDRKNAEEKLREKDYIIDSASSIIATCDFDGMLTYVNPLFYKRTGHNSKETIGKHFSKYWSVGDNYEKIMNALSNEGKWDGELKVHKKDGSTIDVQVSVATIIDNNNKAIGLMSSSIDITERKKVEEALIESEEKFRTLFKSTMAGVAVSTIDGKFIDANDSYLKMLGYTFDELENLTYPELTPEKWHKMESEMFSEALETGISKNFEKEYIRKDGTIIPIVVNAWIMKDQAGNPTRLGAIVTDITERKQTEETIQTTLEKAVQQEKEISALLKASEAVLLDKEFKDCAMSIFKECKNLLGATAGYVALLSDDGIENEVLFLDAGGRTCTVDESLPMPIRGLRAESYKSGKAVYDNDFMQSKWIKFMPGGHMTLDNVMFAPLNIEGKTVGIMGMANKEGGFNENDARLAAAFGDLAAIALSNSRNLGKLKHSQDELDRMFQFADYMVCIADLNTGYFTKVSPAFTRHLGWSEKELLSRAFLDFIHPDDIQRTADIVKEQMEKGLDVIQFENRYMTKKGDFRWFEWSAIPIPEEGITYSAAYDITERKKAEDLLRDSEAKKNALISNISDVIAILDEQGVVQYKSPNIEQHFGWLPEDLVGTDGWETVHID